MSKSIVTLFMTFLVGCIFSQSNSEEQIVKTLREFYVKYITESSKPGATIKSIEPIKTKYCTSNLLDRINSDSLDYDPLLNAQDVDINWLKSLSIARDSVKANVYTISFSDSFTKRKISISVGVVNEKGALKINDIF